MLWIIAVMLWIIAVCAVVVTAVIVDDRACRGSDAAFCVGLLTFGALGLVTLAWAWVVWQGSHVPLPRRDGLELAIMLCPFGIVALSGAGWVDRITKHVEDQRHAVWRAEVECNRAAERAAYLQDEERRALERRIVELEAAGRRGSRG